jgi:hypothetical protein
VMGAVLLDPSFEIGDGIAADAEFEQVQGHTGYQSRAGRRENRAIRRILFLRLEGNEPRPFGHLRTGLG